ncbi:MAG TPA: bile acid:sodium symporter [Nitrospira sp.]|nr:bile acid:sodium symporter [Nitrospira sp.]
MQTILDIAIPAVAFLIMLVVGLDLTVQDFKRLARIPRVAIAAMLGQIVLLPAAAAVLVRTLPLKPHIATGLLLIAACPAGGLSNYYTYLAGANTALSVTLTAGSCLAALGTMPLVMVLYEAYLGQAADVQLPATRLIGHLVLMLGLPVLIGMAVRRLYADFAARHERAFRLVSVVGLAALVGYVVFEEGARVWDNVTETSVVGAAFVCAAMALGYLVGYLSGGGPGERFTLLIEFAVRNVAIATAMAVTVLGHIEFAALGAAYFLIEVPILFAAVAWFRYVSARMLYLSTEAPMS